MRKEWYLYRSSAKNGTRTTVATLDHVPWAVGVRAAQWLGRDGAVNPMYAVYLGPLCISIWRGK